MVADAITESMMSLLIVCLLFESVDECPLISRRAFKAEEAFIISAS